MTTIDPASSQELARIDAEMSEVASAVDGIRIDSADEHAAYADVLVDVIARRKALEEIRTRVSRPMNEALQALRGIFAPAEKKCTDLERAIKSAIDDFRVRSTAKAVEAREALKVAGNVAEASAALDTIAAAQEPDDGPTTTRKTWTWSVADESSIPREFFTLDPLKVNAAVKAGKREIDGLIIFQAVNTVMKRQPRKKTEPA